MSLFSGKCYLESRGNTFSVTLESIQTNKTTGIWIDHGKDSYDDYDSKHSESHFNSKLYDDSQAKPLIAKFGNRYLRASIESGCTPLLTIQFFHDLTDYDVVPTSDPRSEIDAQQLVIHPQSEISKEFKILAPVERRQRTSTKNQDEHVPLTNPVSLPAKFTLGVGAGLVGLILVILILIGLVKLRAKSNGKISTNESKVVMVKDVETPPRSPKPEPQTISYVFVKEETKEASPEHSILECNASSNCTKKVHSHSQKCLKRSPSVRRRLSESQLS